MAAGSQNLSGRFLKQGQTAYVGLSLTQTGETGQTGSVQKIKNPSCLKNLSSSEQE
jgi:hypothetical protein